MKRQLRSSDERVVHGSAVGLAYGDIEAAKRRKKIRWRRNSAAPGGAFGDGTLFPTAHTVGYVLAPLRG